MNAQEHLISPRLPPDRARDLVLRLERTGLETGRILVDVPPPLTAAAGSEADRRAVTRPGLRVIAGILGGAVIGLLVGLILAPIIDTPTVATVVALVIGASLVGGLAALYWRLAMSTELPDVDSGRTSVVRVDVAGLADDEVSTIDRILASA